MAEKPQPSIDLDGKPTERSNNVGMQKEHGTVDVLGPEEEKKLVRKIDLQ
jgi:hypothetical protein